MNDPFRNNRIPIKEQKSLRQGVHEADRRRDDRTGDKGDDPADLRRRAEKIVRGKTARMPENPEIRSTGEARRLVHELQVHQIELEMQNEELRRAQMKLETSQARYFDLYDLAPVGYFTLSEQGFILEANLTAATLLGAARGDLVKQPLSSFILPEDQDIYYRYRQQLFETGAPQVCEMRMVHAITAPFWARVEATLAKDSEGSPVHRAVMSDITDRKQAEEALQQAYDELEHRVAQRTEELRESESRYRTQVEAINDVAYAINSDGEFTYVSPVVNSVLGYKPDEMTGRNFLEFVHPEDRDLLKRKFSELHEGMVSPDYYRLIGKYGDIKWVRTLTRPIIEGKGFAGGRGVIIDITDRRQAEEALRRAEENFRRSLDEHPLGVRIVTIEGDTIYANEAMLAIHGYDTIEELKTTPVKDRYTPESYVEFLIRREKRRQGMDVPFEYTIDIIRKNGEVRHLLAYRKEILWDGERQFQVIYNDITDRRRAEEKLAAEAHEIEETNTALRVLLRRMKEDQKEIERRITANIQKLVLPNLERLRHLHLNDLQANCLEIIATNLHQVTSPFLQNLAACFADFTPREIQVANMTKEGMTSKEIADILNSSIRTVEFHRDNIRKKLCLSHKKTNLRTFLMQLSEK